jgi:hypothetical protein
LRVRDPPRAAILSWRPQTRLLIKGPAGVPVAVRIDDQVSR